MTKQELYFNLYQITGNNEASAPLQDITDFNRELAVIFQKNNEGRISGISLEFCGPKSRFHCSIIPDGPVQFGCGLNSLSMPRVKLNAIQRGLSLLSCLQFMNSNDIINVDFEYYLDRISTEAVNGQSFFLKRYRDICAGSLAYSREHANPLPETPDSYKFTVPEFYAF